MFQHSPRGHSFLDRRDGLRGRADTYYRHRAGPSCDGQVLVIHDVLGLFDRFVPRFVKKYAKLDEVIIEALVKYKEEVEQGIFPGPNMGS